MGAVLDIVRRYIPASYDAMLRATAFGPVDGFQAHADYVKFRLFATAPAASLEATSYDPMLLEFLGKLTAMRLIPPAIDFWGNQRISVDIETGTRNERVMFPERRAQLWELYKRLAEETKADFIELRGLYDFVMRGGLTGITPAVGFGSGDKITPDPRDFGGPFDDKVVETTAVIGSIT